jgi:wyosine [tRNA(Phe)-imidazoG37] synthetase (radical SAM superfamily)
MRRLRRKCPEEPTGFFPLQPGILYGPVRSRRLGCSLGVNLMPGGYKLCSLNCVYCHYGPTGDRQRAVPERPEHLPSVSHVVQALEQAARSSVRFDAITLSGNGEPTLHPDFAEIVEAIVRIRNRCRMRAEIALLSNSTGLGSTPVRNSIRLIDVPIFMLDAGTAETFRAVNRPAAAIDFEVLVDGLASLDGITIQTVLLEGRPTNCSRDELRSYFFRIARIRPKEVHLTTIERPHPEIPVRPVSGARLEEIASQAEHETRVRFRIFPEEEIRLKRLLFRNPVR